MKILHTSDWHLGKRLESKSRLAEQRAVLDELCLVCDAENIDVVIVSGDIFDSVNPPAEAEELFYDFALRLGGGRHFVAISGNHDNADRLKAPGGIASACNIILAGGMDNSVYSKRDNSVIGGEGFVKIIIKGGEVLNLALLPYPSYARMSALGYKQENDEYSLDVSNWLNICAKCFNTGEVNVLVSHLFMVNSERSSDEMELGTALILPPSVLPECDYVALGHVHKPQKVSSSKNAYYSGSILKYSTDDSSQKFFNIVTLALGQPFKLEKRAIVSGRNPIIIKAQSFESAIDGLTVHANDWVTVHYDCSQPLSAAKMTELRGYENFCNIKNIFVSPLAKIESKKHKTDKELFEDFYYSQMGEKVEDDIMDMFLAVLNEEKIQ